MKSPQHHHGPFPRAFTLIEMLVVIAIISVLAAMIFPVTGAIKKKAIKTRAQTELAQVEAAIERYKSKHGFYPPDNPGNPVVHQLYFELLGTILTNLGGVDFYQTLDGNTRIQANTVRNPLVFGPRVTGFVNCTRGGGGDDGPVAVNFLPGLKPAQVAELKANDPSVRLLVCSVLWPEDHPIQPVPTNPTRNPWRYVSSDPTNNPGSYDLWTDIMVGGKANRISNWSRQPQIVSVP